MKKNNPRKNYRNNSNKRKNVKDEKYSNTKEDEQRYPTTRGSYNDVSWYAANPQILKDACSIAFSNPQGAPVNARYVMNQRMPGIARIELLCIPGISSDPTSAINIATRNIYSYVRHANAGHTNYEAPDLMIYLLSMDQAYTYHAWMRRIYLLARTYMQKNRYTPKWLIQSMGIDYDDIVSQLADFRLYINTYAQKLGSLVTPSGMTYFQRHAWVFSNVFADSTSAKAQFYYFNPDSFGIFEPTTSQKGGKMVYKKVENSDNSKLKLSDLIAFGNSMIEPLLSDEDINIMSGDIIKAFGTNLNTLGMITENDAIMPVYNLEVLTQIQNLQVTKFDSDAPQREVTQTDGYLVFNPCLTGEIPTYDDWMELEAPVLFTLPFDSVEPGDVMVASRLIPTFEPKDKKVYLDSAGSEIVTSFNMYNINEDGTRMDIVGSISMTNWGRVSNNEVDWWDCSLTLQTLMALEKFEYHPAFGYKITSGTGTDLEIMFSNIALDVENYTVLDKSDIIQMNEVAILNEFDVPQMGVYKA